MALGLRESRASERRARRRRVSSFLFWVGVIVGAGYFAYATGVDLARRDVSALTAEVAELKQTVTDLQDRNVELEAGLQVQMQRRQEWRQRYEDDVPTGQRKAFLDLIQSRIDAGMDPERLNFLISTARAERECDEVPESKRFLAQSPLYQGANDSVAFADNRVTVTAIGESAQNEQGNPHAWYDPAQPVRAVFTLLGGESSQIEGKLPLHHSVVADGSEYRFTLTPGARGFINVAAERCAYP